MEVQAETATQEARGFGLPVRSKVKIRIQVGPHPFLLLLLRHHLGAGKMSGSVNLGLPGCVHILAAVLPHL